MTECKIYDEAVAKIEDEKEEEFKLRVKEIIIILDEYDEVLKKSEFFVKHFLNSMTLPLPPLTEDEMSELPEDLIIRYNKLSDVIAQHDKDFVGQMLGCLIVFVIIVVLFGYILYDWIFN